MDRVLHTDEERQLALPTVVVAVAVTVVGRRFIVGRRRVIVGRRIVVREVPSVTRFIVPLADSTTRTAIRRASQGGPAALMEAESRPSSYTPSPTVTWCRLGRLVVTASCRLVVIMICRWGRRHEVTALMREKSSMGINLPQGS